ncbi:MAG: hypothetical protein ACT4PZ_06955 [Panacagrimonas sp.]
MIHTNNLPAVIRARIEAFILAGLAGDAGNPAGWPLILSRAKREMRGICGADIALTLETGFPDLYAATTRRSGPYDPSHRVERGEVVQAATR